jgi:hypothetical protein
MRVPVTISTPENETFSIYYDTIACSFYNEDGSMVGNELPTEMWRLAAEIVMRLMDDIEETEEDVTVTVPYEILQAIQKRTND